MKDKTKDEGIEEEEIVADDGDSEGMGEGELDIDEIETADNTSASSKEVWGEWLSDRIFNVDNYEILLRIT